MSEVLVGSDQHLLFVRLLAWSVGWLVGETNRTNLPCDGNASKKNSAGRTFNFINEELKLPGFHNQFQFNFVKAERYDAYHKATVL